MNKTLQNPRLATGDSQTRTRIIEAALRLFDRHGLEAVSTRQIIAEAGQSNQSVIHYYFGGRDGLIEATMDSVMALFQEFDQTLQQSLANQPKQPTVRDIVGALLYPVMQWHSESPQARRAFRFLARLTQSDPKYYQMMIGRLLPYHEPLITRLQAAMPNQAEELVRLKVYYALGSMLHSFSIMRVTLGAGPMQGVPSMKLADIYVDFLAGALQGSTQVPLSSN
ncbi:MAG: TetR/AcrR family transcriptional regulator [Limnobacter sp.]|nr:TetR/AcrR family transcriptional regulator [Limnobacter sp.]